MADRIPSPFRLLALGLAALSLAIPCAAEIQWGVNIHSGGNDPQMVAEKLAGRNFKCVRMDLWANDAAYLERFRRAVACMQEKKLKIETVIYSRFSAGQSRHQDYDADLAEVEKNALDSTRYQLEKTKEIVWDYELQNEVSLYKGIKVPGSSGMLARDFDTPVGRLQAAVLRGMSRALAEVRKTSGQPLRSILGTTDRCWGFLLFMQEQGVDFDVIGYHIYPWLSHKPLNADPWFGEGGPLGQLARFNKPIRLNEFNAGEIYSGGPGQPNKPDYENEHGGEVTEAGFRSLAKHLKTLSTQAPANLEAVLFYELWDTPHKPKPENRFGLYFDKELQQPKISLLLASYYAGGALSEEEKAVIENVIASAP